MCGGGEGGDGGRGLETREDSRKEKPTIKTTFLFF